MTQRNQQSQNLPEMFSHISPQSVIVGAAAAAGAVLAGRWLYNNSDKVTMFLDDITDNISKGSSNIINDRSDNEIDERNPIFKQPSSTNNSNQTSKRNIPVH